MGEDSIGQMMDLMDWAWTSPHQISFSSPLPPNTTMCLSSFQEEPWSLTFQFHISPSFGVQALFKHIGGHYGIVV